MYLHYVQIVINIIVSSLGDSAVGCKEGKDEVWGIQWYFTELSKVAVQPCPGLNGPAGKE